MPWTALHRALGETTETLAFDLIQRACEVQLEERADLDWKRGLLPPEGDDELAKDIAAMANSGGGVIVYGVDEKDGAASKVIPVEVLKEADLRRIRQVAGNLIYPPVVGLQLHRIAPEDNPSGGVLMMVIPDSPEAPHLVHPKGRRDWFTAPWRDGDQTRFMVDRQLATGYREREEHRRFGAASLDDLYRDVITACGADSGLPWVIAVARPETPHHRPRTLDQDAATAALNRARDTSKSIETVYWYGPLYTTRGRQVRRGLRMFYQGTPRLDGDESRLRGRVEIHGDGSVAAAFRHAGIPGEEGTEDHVSLLLLELVGVDLLALVSAAASAVGTSGNYLARLGVSPTTEILRHLEPSRSPFRGQQGHQQIYHRPFEETDRVRGFRPVDGPVLTALGPTAAAESWLDTVTDTLHQAGGQPHLNHADIVERFATSTADHSLNSMPVLLCAGVRDPTEA
ncbi:MAG: AlbA family DNA-binding domain-containing protein [Angustibacter sp.]